MVLLEELSLQKLEIRRHRNHTMADSICGGLVTSKRYLLALAWSIVNLLAFSGFLIAFLYTAYASNSYNPYQYKNNRNSYYQQQNEPEEEAVLSVSTRAMAFVSIWTVVLAIIMAVFGTVVIGFVNLNGRYYWCCSRSVHSTTEMVLGSFMGSLLIFANLTLICAVLFGEFSVRDFREGEAGAEERESGSFRNVYENSSHVFSILCIFLTVLYVGFSALLFAFAGGLLQENSEDFREEVSTIKTSI